MITIESTKATIIMMLAGLSVILVPFNASDATISIMHSEMNDPSMTFDK